MCIKMQSVSDFFGVNIILSTLTVDLVHIKDTLLLNEKSSPCVVAVGFLPLKLWYHRFYK